MKTRKRRAGWRASFLAVPLALVGGVLHGQTPAVESQTAAPPGRILAHWSFDADTVVGDTVTDSGPNGFHGTIQSRNDILPETVPGIRGQALRFPSGHEAWIALDRNLSLRPPFTIAAWVKLGARRGTMELLGQKAHSIREGMRLVFSIRQFLFEYSDGAENVIVRFDPHQTKIDQWVFLAVVHDGKEIALYVDGDAVRREPAREGQWSTRPMLIGNYVNHKDEYRFLGTMDEFVILEEALEGPAVAALGRWTAEKAR